MQFVKSWTHCLQTGSRKILKYVMHLPLVPVKWSTMVLHGTLYRQLHIEVCDTCSTSSSKMKNQGPTLYTVQAAAHCSSCGSSKTPTLPWWTWFCTNLVTLGTNTGRLGSWLPVAFLWGRDMENREHTLTQTMMKNKEMRKVKWEICFMSKVKYRILVFTLLTYKVTWEQLSAPISFCILMELCSASCTTDLIFVCTHTHTHTHTHTVALSFWNRAVILVKSS